MTTPRAHSLFHFTRSLDFLCGILENGFYPRFCLEDTRWLGIDFTPIPMVCFCDIPISRISDHTAFYGQYGIGVTKEWALRNNLQPVIYSPNHGTVAKLLNNMIELDWDKINSISEHFDFNGHFRAITTFTKPLQGNMRLGDQLVEKDFYQENEWRFVPAEFTPCMEDEFDEKKLSLNKSAEESVIKFTPQDVKYLFVRDESEIPALFDFIQQRLGHWPHNDVKILASRITSLSTIGKDV